MFLPAGLNFREIQTRVAVKLGVADHSTGKAQPPTNANTLARIKDAVNDGMSRMAMNYVNWRGLWPTVTLLLDPTGVTGINGDSSMYALPAGVQSGPCSAWSWKADAGYSGIAQDTDISRVQSYSNTITPKGSPKLIACDRMRASANSDDSPQPRWYCFVYPKPNLVYTAKASFRVTARVLIEDTDYHDFGASLDQLVIAAAVMIYQQGSRSAGEWLANYELQLASGKKLDASTEPRSMGPILDPSIKENTFYVPGAALTSVQYNGEVINVPA